MDSREAKLALARKKLKDHQEKKNTSLSYDDSPGNKETEQVGNNNVIEFECQLKPSENVKDVKVIDIPYNIEQNKTGAENTINSNMDVTDLLLHNKVNMEKEIYELQNRLIEMEFNNKTILSESNQMKQHIVKLESEMKILNERYAMSSNDISVKAETIKQLLHENSTLKDENNNLLEELEFTKSVLSSKEIENNNLNTELSKVQHQLEVVQLQLKQLTNGSNIDTTDINKNSGTEHLSEKVELLENQLRILEKERDQINSHYEHYVSELNEQLQGMTVKNEFLKKQVDEWHSREVSLIEQIGEMEKRLQSYKSKCDEDYSKVMAHDKLQKQFDEVHHKFASAQTELQDLRIKYDDLHKLYVESNEKYQKLSQESKSDFSKSQDTIDITKLNADIASDKIAAQRAIEQNKQLKTDLQNLEEAFVKMSKDKLELVEKLSAEKYLNRELTLKLADFEEKANDAQKKLKAKDEEMIRLQNTYKDIEKHMKQNHEITNTEDSTDQSVPNIISEHVTDNHHACSEHEHKKEVVKNENNIPTENAMIKLQERFLKIMGDVADLSDEKHRLEHIILQLQNETETICEYVALYQQQRSLLKKRDEERAAHMKIFQSECDKLKRQLEELTGILMRIAEDKDISTYFQIEEKKGDLAKIMDLLLKLKQNSLIDNQGKNMDLHNFYPCNCCSGKLIDV